MNLTKVHDDTFHFPFLESPRILGKIYDQHRVAVSCFVAEKIFVGCKGMVRCCSTFKIVGKESVAKVQAPDFTTKEKMKTNYKTKNSDVK